MKQVNIHLSVLLSVSIDITCGTEKVTGWLILLHLFPFFVFMMLR